MIEDYCAFLCVVFFFVGFVGAGIAYKYFKWWL